MTEVVGQSSGNECMHGKRLHLNPETADIQGRRDGLRSVSADVASNRYGVVSQ